MIKAVTVFLGFLLGGAALAQESAHFVIKGAVINAGGDPSSVMVPASASFALRPDSIGDAIVDPSMTSSSFRMGAGFVMSFPPPGEVVNLRFNDSVTLLWDPQPLARSYNLYRTGEMGPSAGVPPSADCDQSDLLAATATDSDLPALGHGFFYLVTAVNVIRLEGPDGLIGARCP